MIYQGDLMDTIKVEYIFGDSNISLDEIIISILNSKLKVVDFEQET